jgi:amino acid adenylation domain-containing protein
VIGATRTTLDDHAALLRHPRPARLVLSYSQQALWLVDRLNPGSNAYNATKAFRFRGHLDHEALSRAINTILARHEVLRTHFREVGGVPEQEIEPESPYVLSVEDLSNLKDDEQVRSVSDRIRREAEEPFDLTCGPLFRARVLRLGPQEHILVRTMHHIACDGWSDGIFKKELALLYGAYRAGRENPLPPLRIQYADFAGWQREYMTPDRLQPQLSYWKERIQNIPKRLDLPVDGVRSAGAPNSAAVMNRPLPLELAASVRRLAQNERATPFMVFTAVLHLLLMRWSGQTDIVIGAPAAARTFPALEIMIGCFVNTLLLRLEWSPKGTFRENLRQVRQVCLDAYAHQDVPFEWLVEDANPQRDVNHNPLFQVMLDMLSFPQVCGEMAGIEIEEVTAFSGLQSKFDFTLYVDAKRNLSLKLLYNSALFSAGRMSELLDQYALALHHSVQEPDKPAHRYSLITKKARLVLPDPTVPLDNACHDTVVHRFLESVLRHPSRPAVIDASREWTYEELEDITHRLACSLVRLGLTGKLIAVYASRNAELVQSLLAIWRANAGFLILNPQYPNDQLISYLRVAKPAAFVNASTQDPLPIGLRRALEELSIIHRLSVRSEGLASTFPDCPGTDLPDPAPSSLAYLAFTSGTTGIPKAVIGTHAPLAHGLDWYARRFALDCSHRFAMLSGLNHDPLFRDVFLPLSIGACVCIPDNSMTAGDGLSEWLDQNRVSVIHLTPTLGQLLSDLSGRSCLPYLRYACFGGELLTHNRVEQFHRLAPKATVVNFYGTTETPQMMSCWVGDRRNTPSMQNIPLGTGISGAQLLVLGDGRLCGISELGEICVRTSYLTQGYLGDEALTAQRFVRNPFTERLDDLIYKTGDLGRYNTDGTVAYAGRLDEQVKIRGCRVELGQIEAALLAQAGVRKAVAILRPNNEGEALIVGYVVASPGYDLDVSEIRRELRRTLPTFMLPAAIIPLSRLPLTPNGKLDYEALAPPDFAQQDVVREPRTPSEAALCALFAEVLGRERVGIDDDFFALGGQSLMATRLANRIRAAFGRNVSTRTIFEAPSVSVLAAYLGV